MQRNNFIQDNSMNQFETISKLGSGSFSTVYKVRRIDDNKMYAMKKVKIGQMRQKQKQNALNQVRILASINHPNIINYKQAFFDTRSGNLCIVMQLADAGDVQYKINNHIKCKTYFTEKQIWFALIQMSKGLKSLHDINILHRDLKCANVFCTNQGKFKLGDLNVSKVSKKGMARTQTGTPYYTSPQIWKDKPYDSKCDIWSLGCVIYEMSTLKPPFRASNLKELNYKIQRGLYDNIPTFYSDDLKTIIGLCLKVNPISRLSADEILQYPKVIKNMSINQMYTQDNNQTIKCCLLRTIQVPKNLKLLKQALPGSKYDMPKISEENGKKYRRANSVKNIGQNNSIERIITTPKSGEQKKNPLHYPFIHKPIKSVRNNNNSNRQQQKSQNNEINNSHQNNIKNSNIINNNNSNRNNNSSNKIMKIQKISRNNSLDNIRSNRLNSNNSINSSRQQNSHSKKVKQDMQDITNRCKQIQNRVKNLMEKKKQNNFLLANPKNQPRLYSKEKIYPKIQHIYHRNKSIQIKRNQIPYTPIIPLISRNKSIDRIDKLSYKYLDRSNNNNKSIDKINRSIDKNKSIDRISNKSIQQDKNNNNNKNASNQMKYLNKKNYQSRKRYGYVIPPKIK